MYRVSPCYKRESASPVRNMLRSLPPPISANIRYSTLSLPFKYSDQNFVRVFYPYNQFRIHKSYFLSPVSFKAINSPDGQN